MKHRWNKIIAQRVPLGLIVAGLGLALVGAHLVPVIASQYSEAQILKNVFQLKSPQPSANVPVRLRIPAIQVDAPIITLGLAPDGSMDVPKGPNELAWFGLGPRPGNKGSAVIAGHYGWKNGIPAVFDDLRMLQRGDLLYIEDDAGKTVTFVVREMRIYGEDDDAAAVFGSTDDGAHLNLITCSGSWNASQKSYSNRIVVFTDKVVE